MAINEMCKKSGDNVRRTYHIISIQDLREISGPLPGTMLLLNKYSQSEIRGQFIYRHYFHDNTTMKNATIQDIKAP